MVAPLFGGTNGTPSNSVVNYVSIVGALAPTPTATETARLCVVPAAFTLKNFYVSINNAPGSGKSYVFTVRKNQVDTALTITISDSAISGTDTAHTVDFVAGDTISLSIAPSGTPTAPTYLLWNLQADSGATHFFPLIGGAQATTNLSTSAVSYAALTGTSNGAIGWSAVEAQQEIVCPTSGVVSALYVVTDVAPGAAKSYAIALVKNGTLTSLSAVVTGSATKTGNDTVNSVNVVAGDVLSVAATPTGTPTVGRYVWGLKFTPSVPGESFFGFGNATAPSTTTTQYELPLLGIGTFSTTESSRQMAVGACMLKAAYCLLGTAPGSGKSRTLTIRRNSVSSPLTVAIVDANTVGSSTGKNVGLTQADLVSLQSIASNTPAACTNGVHVGVLMFIPVSNSYASSGFFGLMR